ncbi:MAG: pilus assembly protein N-terminal domain-containing protein, partial [Micavibrio aeruginosavorus]|nr:pilus assembly protein N-terminal domain-containing protein [Micavibrio aeruginosavorus]
MKLPSYTGFPALALLCGGLLLAAISTTAMAQWANSASTPAQSADTAAEAPDGNIQSIIPSSGSSPKVTYGADQPGSEDTHPALRLTPDKSELLQMDNDVASVVIGNPDHLGVLMDNTRLLILLPRKPGATYLTLLDVDGKVLMQRHVLVASPKSDYVRIRRSCGGNTS